MFNVVSLLFCGEWDRFPTQLRKLACNYYVEDDVDRLYSSTFSFEICCQGNATTTRLCVCSIVVDGDTEAGVGQSQSLGMCDDRGGAVMQEADGECLYVGAHRVGETNKVFRAL